MRKKKMTQIKRAPKKSGSKKGIKGTSAKKASPRKRPQRKAAPKPKRYLVTGACGFTGSHLVDVLIEAGVEVRTTDLPGSDRRYLPKDSEFVAADLRDAESLDRVVKGIQVVLHPAAIFKFSAPMELLQQVNVEGMNNLCRAAVAAGVERLVSWSTCGIYGRIPLDTPPIREDYPRRPIEDYSRSKLQQDRIAHRFYKEEGLAISIVRPGVVYGPRSRYGAAQIIEYLSKAPIIPIPFNFKFHLGPVHARDVARAALFISQRQEAVGEEYHVVDCSGATMAEYFTFLASLLNKPNFPVYVPPRLAGMGGRIAGEISEFVSKKILDREPLIEKAPMAYFPVDVNISNRKLLDLGFRFDYPDFRKGIVETIDWLRSERII